MSKIKEYFWIGVIGLAVIFVAMVLRDQNTVANLKSILRRKKVEEDVNEIKAKLKISEEEAKEKEEQLIEIAEKMREEEKKAKEATESEIQEFWDGYFNE